MMQTASAAAASKVFIVYESPKVWLQGSHVAP